jgi:hypothetical protein
LHCPPGEAVRENKTTLSLKYTFETVAIYMRDGAKFNNIGVEVLLWNEETARERLPDTYIAAHFFDQVGRSFSNNRVYTESSFSQPIARRPEGY